MKFSLEYVATARTADTMMKATKIDIVPTISGSNRIQIIIYINIKIANEVVAYGNNNPLQKN